MASKFTKIQVRRGTAARWGQANTILEAGEIGLETDTYRFKIGQVNPATGTLYDWNSLPYFAETLVSNDITLDGSINLTDNSCFDGDVVPCADDAFTLGEAARRWKELHVSQSIQLGDIEITQGPANDGTSENFLKVNGDDIATRSELQKLDTENLPLANPSDPLPPYINTLFNVLERALPPRDGISSQSQFNGWVVAALEHLDEGLDSDGDTINIGGDTNVDVIIGPGPGAGCANKLDIYNETTVHCELSAKQGIKVLDGTTIDFVKADGTISNELPLEQSLWTGLSRL